jgi:hypothetical protein
MAGMNLALGPMPGHLVDDMLGAIGLGGDEHTTTTDHSHHLRAKNAVRGANRFKCFLFQDAWDMLPDFEVDDEIALWVSHAGIKLASKEASTVSFT